MSAGAVQPNVASVRTAIRRFNDYCSDLIAADMNTFVNRVAILVHFCKSDPVFSQIRRQLVCNPCVDFTEWLKTACDPRMRGRNMVFPVDEDDRLSLMYQVLELAESEGAGFINHLPTWFIIGSSKINAYIGAFVDAVVQPLYRDLGYKLRAIEESLPTNSKEVVSPSTLQVITNSGILIQQIANGDNNQQSTQVANEQAEVARSFAALREAVLASPLSEAEKSESMELVSHAEEQAKLPDPKKSVIKALLASLPSVVQGAGLVEKILSALKHFGHHAH